MNIKTENEGIKYSSLEDSDSIKPFDDWLFTSIRPYIKGRTLETNSGASSITSFFINNSIPIHLNETNPTSREILINKFKDNPTVRGIHKIDLLDSDFQTVYQGESEALSTILLLNFSSLMPLLPKLIDNAHFLLRQNGHLVFSTPIQTTVYNWQPGSYKDLKIYNHKYITGLVRKEYEILMTTYFNILLGPSMSQPTHSGLFAVTVARKL